MISSEQCKYCNRDIALSTKNPELLAFWFHPHTGSVRCHFDKDNLATVYPTRYAPARRATPEDG